jgi:hypothetical protein
MNVRTSTTHAAALVFVALFVALSCAWPARAQGTGARGPANAGAARKRPATGSISGRVVGEGGEPLPQVTVQVRLRGATPNAARTPTLVTDEEGGFVARNLEAGVYSVWANYLGYVTEPEQAGGAQGHRLGDFVIIRMVRGGVITGTVTDASGTPLAALGVMALRVRDHEGRPTPSPNTSGVPSLTDDRGIYRNYGLAPGVYVVVAGNMQFGGAGLSPYDGDAPTFFPSATRDAAAEVTVRAGQEVVGIDIRYRDERGRRISGTLALPAPAPPDVGVGVTLSYAGSNAWAGGTWIGPQEGAAAPSFSLEGIADGDYELQAQLQTRDGAASSSVPLRVSVRGADVTGLKLVLAPLAAAAGTLSVEAAPEALRALPDCKERISTMLPQEALVVARRDTRATPEPAGRGPQQREAAPEESGAFALRNLEPGVYRFEARLLDENFYARPFQLPATATTPARTPAANAGRAPGGPLRLNSGQQLNGLSVRLAAGAAGVAGRVVAAEVPGTPPVAFSALRVHLVPAERERAEETSSYAEVTPTADGSFTFKQLAPGRYLLVARPADAGEFPPRPASWDADSRARLRREAEAANIALDLQPCQRVSDFTLRHPHTPGK